MKIDCVIWRKFAKDTELSVIIIKTNKITYYFLKPPQ